MTEVTEKEGEEEKEEEKPIKYQTLWLDLNEIYQRHNFGHILC